MLTKNKSDIYKGAAIKIGEDEKLVSKIGDFVFDDLKTQMAEFNGYSFYMYKLGTFKIRAGAVEKYLKKLIVLLNNQINITDNELNVIAVSSLTTRSAKIRKLLDDYYSLMDKKKELKQKIKDEQFNRDIQEQKTDMGGDEEQSL